MRSWLPFVLVLVVSAPSAAQVLSLDATPPPTPTPVVVHDPPSPPAVRATRPARDERDDVAPFVALGFWGEQMNLSGARLTFGRPEVQAVQGLVLGEDWAGAAALAEQGLGGVSLDVGVRAAEFLRGPELRLMFGGGDVNGAYAPTGVEGIEVALQSAATFRIEAAIGLQVPLGPVVPYVLGRAAIGGVWIDVGVRDARLGELGTETLELATYELGVEAGVAFRVVAGVELGVAFRASFLRNESLGGVMTIGFDGSTMKD